MVSAELLLWRTTGQAEFQKLTLVGTMSTAHHEKPYNLESHYARDVLSWRAKEVIDRVKRSITSNGWK